MPPIQSRRSRKQRETVYINGQHTNLLKEISSPGSDGTVPLLNFLENTDRFIADTSHLHTKVAYLERELEKYKNMNSDFKQMKTHLQQMTEYLNNINLQDARPTLTIPQFNTDYENTDINADTISENTPLSSISNIQHNYFKRDSTKKSTQPFPNFSHDHPIKINLDLDEPLQSINNDIILLPNSSAHTYKMGTGLSDIVKDIDQEPSANKDNENVLLPNSAGIRSTILLNDIYNNSPENTSNETSVNNLTLIHNSSLRGSRLNINLYEPIEFEFQSEFQQNIERQLTNDSNEIEMILQKNQVSRSSKMGKLLNHRNTRRAYNASIISNNETETNENDRYNVKLINSSTLRKPRLMNELYESNAIYQYDEIDDYDQTENTNILLENGTTRGGLKLKFNRRNTKKAYSEIDPEPYIINKSDDNQEHQTYLLKPKQRHHGSQLNYTNEQLNEPINDQLIEPSNIGVSLVYKNSHRGSKMTVYPPSHILNPEISQNSAEIEELEYIRDLLLNSE